MKASREWLEEYSDIDVDTIKLGDILTMTGSKVETIEQKGNEIKNVVIGKILEVKKHPDADKLVVTKIDVGNGEIVQVVTAATNIKVDEPGQIVPVARDGAELPKGVKIKTGKLRGVESQGMMCGMEELEIDPANYPDKVVDGIFILDNEYEKYIGQNIVDVLDLKEDIIDFEITPNRPDCLSIEGLGRETAVSLEKEFKNPRKTIDELKIEDKKEQQRLKKLVKENLSTGNGAVIRTSAAGKESEIIEEIKSIEKKWNDIKNKFDNYKSNKPCILLKANNIVQKMIIDLPEDSIKKITVNDKKEYEKIVEIKNDNNYLKNMVVELKENEDVLDKYDLKKEIAKLENRKIWLKCGGFITIDKTEALTAIDINTGKYTGKYAGLQRKNHT